MNMDSLICSSCNSKMDKIKEPDITIDRCSNCGGTFLDKGELDALATGMAGQIEFCSSGTDEQIDKHPYRKCPRPACAGNEMNKVALLVYLDTMFDYCENCGGFFLDRTEIGEMNLELEQITKDKVVEEFRGYIDQRLVRLDKILDVMQIGAGGFDVPTKVAYLRISVYFKNSLGLGLRLYSEKWTDKFVKLIGLSKKQDIQLGDEKLDPLFIIQGTNKREIKSLLSKSEIQKQLIEVSKKKFKIYAKRGTMEIADKRIIYTEGPYTGDAKYDVKEDRIGVVKAMLNLSNAFESNI